jgi:hypothetical protein
MSYEMHLNTESARKKETSAVHNMQENSIEMQIENLIFHICSSFFSILDNTAIVTNYNPRGTL